MRMILDGTKRKEKETVTMEFAQVELSRWSKYVVVDVVHSVMWFTIVLDGQSHKKR